VSRRVPLGRLELHEQSPIHDHVQACLADPRAFVEHVDPDLPDEWDGPFRELQAEGLLVQCLQKPRSKDAMDLDGRSDHGLRQPIQTFLRFLLPALALCVLRVSAAHISPSVLRPIRCVLSH